MNTIERPVERTIERIVAGQGATGIALAALLIAAWIALHVASVFAIDWSQPGMLTLAPVALALQCWLSVGLFIIAHDAMHGSLAPGRPGVNFAFGQLCIALYAGFSFSRLSAKHREHHAHAGTAEDPDFDPEPPQRFWHWYARFLGEYFGWREYLSITVLFLAYMIATGADPVNLFVFWGVPSILASLQLFYFGTYLPHRPGCAPFTDRHRTRSNEYSWWASLLTCFHFGYHHEHHEFPFIPWWRLPAVRRAARA